jgi:hypothetical protein
LAAALGRLLCAAGGLEAQAGLSQHPRQHPPGPHPAGGHAAAQGHAGADGVQVRARPRPAAALPAAALLRPWRGDGVGGLREGWGRKGGLARSASCPFTPLALALRWQSFERVQPGVGLGHSRCPSQEKPSCSPKDYTAQHVEQTSLAPGKSPSCTVATGRSIYYQRSCWVRNTRALAAGSTAPTKIPREISREMKGTEEGDRERGSRSPGLAQQLFQRKLLAIESENEACIVGLAPAGTGASARCSGSMPQQAKQRLPEAIAHGILAAALPCHLYGIKLGSLPQLLRVGDRAPAAAAAVREEGAGRRARLAVCPSQVAWQVAQQQGSIQ